MFGSRRRRRAPFTAVWPTRVDGDDDAEWGGEAEGGAADSDGIGTAHQTWFYGHTG